MKNMALVLAVLSLTILLFSCSPKIMPVEETGSPKATEGVPQAPARETWQQEWDKTVITAKKEGALTIFTTTMSVQERVDWAKVFKDKFDIFVEVIAAQGPELVPRLLQERKAGIFRADIYIGGSSTMYGSLKPARVLDKWEHLLFLPEVINPDSWYGRKLPWIDEDHTMFSSSLAPSGSLFINTSLVRPDEIKSYWDFLAPKWKGKILLYDPTIFGQGSQWFQQYIQSGVLGYDFMNALTKQEPVITRNNRLQAEWLAHGRYAISIAVGLPSFLPLIEAGAPVKMIVVAEPDYLSAASSVISIIEKAPHPAAAKLFVNWLLGKEGQLLGQKARGRPSARMDIGSEGVTPEAARIESVKYILAETEKSLQARDFYFEKAREIFGPLIK